MNTSFDSLDLSPETLKSIEKMGFTNTTPIQSQGVPLIMSGRDVLGQAQTGTGKTTAFGIPAIEIIDTSCKQVQVLVLCPTRELAVQVADEFSKLAAYKNNAAILAIYGGQSIDIQLRLLAKKPQIIVGTPGRMMDHIKRGTINLKHVSMLILDEADEMLNMGFRDDLEAILAKTNKDAQKVFFSATMAPAIIKLAEKYLNNPSQLSIKSQALTVPAIDQYYYLVRDNQKMDALCRVIDATKFRKALIFCMTQRGVDNMNDRLQARGYQTDALHGGLPQTQRDKVMKRFRSGGIEILTATDVAARGLDVDDIDVVINYDLPNDVGSYVHRIGRTGRAGRDGASYSFVTNREQRKLRDIMNYTKAKIYENHIPTLDDVVKMKTTKIQEDTRSVIENNDLKVQARIIQHWQDEGMDLAKISAAMLKLIMAHESCDATDSDVIAQSFKPDFSSLALELPKGSKKRSQKASSGRTDYGKKKPKSKTSPFSSFTQKKQSQGSKLRCA